MPTRIPPQGFTARAFRGPIEGRPHFPPRRRIPVPRTPIPRTPSRSIGTAQARASPGDGRGPGTARPRTPVRGSAGSLTTRSLTCVDGLGGSRWTGSVDIASARAPAGYGGPAPLIMSDGGGRHQPRCPLYEHASSLSCQVGKSRWSTPTHSRTRGCFSPGFFPACRDGGRRRRPGSRSPGHGADARIPQRAGYRAEPAGRRACAFRPVT